MCLHSGTTYSYPRLMLIRAWMDDFKTWHIFSVARCNLTFPLEMLSFLAYPIIVFVFPLGLKDPPKHGFWTLQEHLLATTIVDIFCLNAGIKRSHSRPSQGDNLDGPKGACLSRYARSRIVIVNNGSSSLVSHRWRSIDLCLWARNIATVHRVGLWTLVKSNGSCSCK